VQDKNGHSRRNGRGDEFCQPSTQFRQRVVGHRHEHAHPVGAARVEHLPNERGCFKGVEVAIGKPGSNKDIPLRDGQDNGRVVRPDRGVENGGNEDTVLVSALEVPPKRLLHLPFFYEPLTCTGEFKHRPCLSVPFVAPHLSTPRDGSQERPERALAIAQKGEQERFLPLR